LKNFGELFKFFIVFFFFSCGITTVISFAAIFAEREVGFSGSDLIAFFIIVQISSALGAFLFGFIQDRIGARTTINCTLAIWILVVVGAYFTHSIRMFYIIGNLAGISIGSSTSSSRALVALFSPEDRTAEFFGFWGLFWKLSSALGPLTFGIISSVTGSERFAILATGCFFVIGFIGMFFINEKKGREEVANYLNRQALLNR
jgi:UMF1 family MFS transporter